MTDLSHSPTDTDIVRPETEHYLKAAVAGRGNPFKDFDWGDHLITWPQVSWVYDTGAHELGRRTRHDRIFEPQRLAMETCI
jgi:hypothetical protein